PRLRGRRALLAAAEERARGLADPRAPPRLARVRGAGRRPRQGARLPRRAPLRAPGRQLPVRALGLPGAAERDVVAARARAQLGPRAGRDPGPDVGAELPGGER